MRNRRKSSRTSLYKNLSDKIDQEALMGIGLVVSIFAIIMYIPPYSNLVVASLSLITAVLIFLITKRFIRFGFAVILGIVLGTALYLHLIEQANLINLGLLSVLIIALAVFLYQK